MIEWIRALEKSKNDAIRDLENDKSRKVLWQSPIKKHVKIK
jgi:hypothetical protein